MRFYTDNIYLYSAAFQPNWPQFCIRGRHRWDDRTRCDAKCLLKKPKLVLGNREIKRMCWENGDLFTFSDGTQCNYVLQNVKLLSRSPSNYCKSILLYPVQFPNIHWAIAFFLHRADAAICPVVLKTRAKPGVLT